MNNEAKGQLLGRGEVEEQRLTVLHVTTGGVMGGAAAHVETLSAELAALGCRPVLAHLRDGPAVSRARARGLSVHVLGQRRRGDLGLVLRLRRLIRDCGADVVHTHTPSGNFYGRLAARLARTPATVTTVHGFLREQVHLARRGRLARSIMAWTDERMHGWSHRVIAVSEGLHRRLQAHVDPGSLRLVRCGVALSDAPGASESERARQELALPRGRKVIGTVGRLVAVKRHDLLVKALAFLPETHLLLVGDGPLGEVLKREAATLGMAERVHFTGWSDRVSALLGLMDVYVQSSDSEGFPLAMMEAMGQGRPIVSTAVGGIPELITHEQTGLLVPAGDAVALARAVGSLLADSTRAARLGSAARAAACGNLDIRQTARRTLAIYREATAVRQGRALSRDGPRT